MIVDSLSNIELFKGLNQRLYKGLQFLTREDTAKLNPGTYEIEGKDLYISVSEYTPQPESQRRWEAHKKYIDIQCLFCGTEKIGFTSVKELTASQAYDEEKDIYFLEGNKGDYVTMKKGMFAIFYPDDAHKPCIALSNPSQVKKFVVKVRI
ncbi:MAG: YhcH/YjgK/YiaL family protein [Bacteroidota bacterium]|nr:YhcH/YjgK/YiaL family protein [Bacteroidota bacterium]MDP4225722.1 YhcH/YjgK/YiaL family protein [Bacteroidota bacterium]MDP4272904.1 YhcH/YjgK/YiaL family protein [Bacteroidota bacterium]